MLTCLQLFPACFLCSFLFLVPESPRWLLLRDRDDEALSALRRYLGKGLAEDDPMVQDEYKSIRSAIAVERMSKISLKEVLLCRDRSSHFKRLLLGMGGQFMQQMSGRLLPNHTHLSESHANGNPRYQRTQLLFQVTRSTIT